MPAQPCAGCDPRSSFDERAGRAVAIIGSTPAEPPEETTDRRIDMSEMPPEPDSGTPADRAAGSMSESEYLGKDDGADGGAGEGDSTTQTDEDSRFA